jgi:hypothetical protein
MKITVQPENIYKNSDDIVYNICMGVIYGGCCIILFVAILIIIRMSIIEDGLSNTTEIL